MGISVAFGGDLYCFTPGFQLPTLSPLSHIVSPFHPLGLHFTDPHKAVAYFIFIVPPGK